MAIFTDGTCAHFTNINIQENNILHGGNWLLRSFTPLASNTVFRYLLFFGSAYFTVIVEDLNLQSTAPGTHMYSTYDSLGIKSHPGQLILES